MPKVIFKVPSYEDVAVTIYYLIKDKKQNYRNNIFVELPKELIDKIVSGRLETVKKEIIKNIKEAHNTSKLEEVKNEIEKTWQPLNDLFFNNLKKITGFDFPFDKAVVYISEIVRGMYSLENNVFINPMKNMTSYVIAEEIFHLHYWDIFRKTIKDVKIPWRLSKETWEISEVVPEFVLTDDKFNFLFNYFLFFCVLSIASIHMDERDFFILFHLFT